MRAGSFSISAGLYLLLFFTYLFGPLIVMVITAFNSASFPRVAPWECLTSGWFQKLAADDRLLEGIGTSLIIGAGVVLVAVPIGLAAAIMLSQVGPRVRPVLYTAFIAPILTPGVVIGLSTLIFWDRIALMIGADYDSFFYNGIFLTITGQVTFISAYSMLVFLSRIQRFDPTLTEAALDMGATPTQAFVKVLLPFMAPAIASASVLAFLASMENYNTTVFTVVSESTFTTVLAGKVRYGLDPSISAVAVIIVATTLVLALIFETAKRRAARAEAGLLPMDRPFIRAVSHPATVAALMLALVGGAVAWGMSHDSSECELRILEDKRAIQRELQEKRLELQRQNAPAPTAPAPSAPGGVFSPGNLAPSPAPAPGGAFAPGNLAPSAAPAPGGGAFAPGNLAPGGD